MTSTTYYNLNIVEGTDIVNPLIVDNPNYEKIDEAMHDNAVAGVTLATEIANATVHAITRENSDCAVIRFIATSEWKAGDTATVDGVPVTTLLPSGETLPDGAYVINANVLCILTGTNLTVYLDSKKVENANEIPFNDTTVGAELVKLDREIVNLDGEIVRLDGKIDNVNSNLSDVCIRYPYMSNLIANMDITSTSSDCVYTATENCWAYFNAYMAEGNSANDCIIYINGKVIANGYLRNTYDAVNVFVPLKKGDVIKFNTASFYKQYSIYGVR